MNTELPLDIETFLGCRTPESWLELAASRIPDLLVDHAQCEKKAASSALQLMFRYPHDEELASKMSKLAREELRHFEQVLKLMRARCISDRKQTGARYANGLREHVRKTDPERLVDILIIGAFIEARSCERFARLVPYLDSELGQFYRGLLESEGRHYQGYLSFAKSRWLSAQKERLGVARAQADFDSRVNFIREVEQDLIQTPDPEFRFHSGAPIL